MTDSPRSVAPTSEEWQRRLDAAQAEALADLARWANPLSVPPPLEPEGADSGPAPTLAQAEQAKAALAREFPAWSIWYGTRWYAAGPCPCAPACTGRCPPPADPHAHTPSAGGLPSRPTLPPECPGVTVGLWDRAERRSSRASTAPTAPAGTPADHEPPSYEMAVQQQLWARLRRAHRKESVSLRVRRRDLTGM